MGWAMILLGVMLMCDPLPAATDRMNVELFANVGSIFRRTYAVERAPEDFRRLLDDIDQTAHDREHELVRKLSIIEPHHRGGMIQ